MKLQFNFNSQAFNNTVELLQERQRGDTNNIILAVIDRKSRPVEARHGVLKGQRVQLVTIRPIVSAGWDGMKNRPVFSVSGLNRPVLAANEWMGFNWLEDITRRTKACLKGEDFPLHVRRFLLEGNGPDASFANVEVYGYLSQLYAAISREPGDLAARESARLADLAAVAKPSLLVSLAPAFAPRELEVAA